MEITIRKAPDGVYDVWEGSFKKWLFSTAAPENLLSYLEDLKVPLTIKFVDAEVEEILAKK